MRVKDILREKKRAVVTIEPGETVKAAVGKLVENNIGAMPVVEKERVVGIVSERDLMRQCAVSDSSGKKMRDIMTRDVCFCLPDDEIDYVMNIMLQKGVRHLPVMDEQRLIGIISARDVMEARLEACRVEVRHLSNYIAGGFS